MAKRIYSKVCIKKPKVVFKDLSKDGVVGYALEDEHEIQIDPKQTDRELFLTCLHESLGHLLLPDLTEKQVVRIEKTYGVIMWNIVLRLRRKWKKQWETEHHL